MQSVETSESDNSQNEAIQVDSTSQEVKNPIIINTPDTSSKRNRKRKQDTPQDRVIIFLGR